MFRREDLLADYRELTREMLLRFDRSQRELNRKEHERHEAEMAEIARSRAEAEAHHEREMRRLDEVIAENEAQREALFAILDELRGNGGPAAAT